MSTPMNDGTSPQHSSPRGGQQENGAADPLLSVRLTLILLAALLFALLCGGLMFLSTEDTAAAALMGLTAFGMSTVWLHKLIDA